MPLLLLFMLVIAACTSSGSGDPVKTVEDYLTAKVAGDQTTLRGLLCSSMEADLTREATSFAGLSAKLDNMSCQRDGSSDVVTCTGQIDVTYGTENSNFPLASYKVVQEDGQWKWCGEAQAP
ncbi:MAG TPA: hypothetical protein VHD90_14735 [Phototrophicaceae bacterium]|nr:hypothetical protein [Phototrophicaceae bacterium]